ncbi:hypothetical protein D3C87_1345380 [compost metagenome]
MVAFAISENASAEYKLRADMGVIQELQTMFAPFSKISSQQYIQLKNSKNAQLLEAQASLYQYLLSTEDILSPLPDRSNHYQEIAEMTARPQLFENPIMMQTALEVISHEFAKGDPGDDFKGPVPNCPLVAKAIRFMGDGVGRTPPGVDHEGNMLLIMQMFYSYNLNETLFMLPCQREIDMAGGERLQGQIGYRDLETREALVKLVRYYSRNGEFEFDYSREYITGLFGNSKGKQVNYSTNVTLGSSQARITISQRHPRKSDQFLYSWAQFENPTQNKRVGTSLDVIRRYSELATPYLGQ